MTSQNGRSGYDYVIVGGGTAGCAIAARLSELPDASVLLLEAGPKDTNPFIHIPAGYFKLTGGPLTWGYNTAPQKHANNREIPYAQGRVLGGSSSINGEVFTRGAPEDYDGWAEDAGCTGWSFKDVAPFFLKSEDNEILSGEHHSIGGPQGVSDNVSPCRLSKVFVQACQEAGIPFTADFNSGVQNGCNIYQSTTRNARRCSTAKGYLTPDVKARPNLTIQTGCLTDRLVFDGGCCVGVEYRRNGQSVSVRAESEVIVTAGAIGSPKLLMLSGLGPADHLRSHGIEVVQDMAGVGQNLQDHFDVDIIYELTGPYSYDKYAKLHWMLWAGLEYALFRKGPAASTLVEGGAFCKLDADSETADTQFHFLPGSGLEAGIQAPDSGFGCTLNSYYLRPKSRGSVTLRSSDPNDAPAIDPNYIAEPEDLRITIEGIKKSREIMSQSAFSKYIKKEHFPGDDVRNRADFEEYARQYGRTAYHPVGSCKMGSDPKAVVDPELRVRGISGLRVCDSSVMPSLVSSNTNAPTIMIAEKAADLIKFAGAETSATSIPAD